jgi:hypothetical protein
MFALIPFDKYLETNISDIIVLCMKYHQQTGKEKKYPEGVNVNYN